MTDRLYAPWREEFILGPKADGCIFCHPEHNKHIRELIVHRGKRVFVVMNRYPYTSGHLLIIPYQHVAQLDELSGSVRNELMAMTASATGVLRKLQNPAGFNIGMNLGHAAGAGIADHLHMHLVPRWVGDTNFLPAIFDTRIVSVDLLKLRKQLRAAFRRLANK